MIFLLLAIVLLTTAPVFAADITGLVAIITGSGRIVPGAKVNIFLVTKEITLRTVTTDPACIDYRVDVLDAHGEAFRAFKDQSASNPLYITAGVKTSLEGKFKFQNIKPGSYFITVEGLDRIAFNLVFWQIPVLVGKDDIYVEMTNDNLALPPLFIR
jgi:hypothetical protein